MDTSRIPRRAVRCGALLAAALGTALAVERGVALPPLITVAGGGGWNPRAVVTITPTDARLPVDAGLRWGVRSTATNNGYPGYMGYPGMEGQGSDPTAQTATWISLDGVQPDALELAARAMYSDAKGVAAAPAWLDGRVYLWRCATSNGSGSACVLGATDRGDWNGAGDGFTKGALGNRVMAVVRQAADAGMLDIQLRTAGAGIDDDFANPYGMSEQNSYDPYMYMMMYGMPGMPPYTPPVDGRKLATYRIRADAAATDGLRLEIDGARARLVLGATPLPRATDDLDGWVNYVGGLNQPTAPLASSSRWLQVIVGGYYGEATLVASPLPTPTAPDIRYEIDGVPAPSAGGAPYRGPVIITRDGVLRARVACTGLGVSPDATVAVDVREPELPTSSPVSPACVEGWHRDPYGRPSPVVVGGVAAGALAADRWYADVPLDPNGARSLDVTAGGAPLATGAITWEAVPIDSWRWFTLRVGDALLLTSDRGARWSEYEDCGVGGGGEQHIGPGERVVKRFTTPGRYTLWSTSDDGWSSGGVTVTVCAADMPGDLACHVNYMRPVPGSAAPDLGAINVEAGDPDLIQCGTNGWDPQNPYQVRPLKQGDATVILRAGWNGPVLAVRPVRAFTLVDWAERFVRVVEKFPDGTKRGECALTVKPLIRGLDTRLDIIVGGVLFLNGTTRLDANTDAFTASGDDGDFAWGMTRAPDGWYHWCHTIRFFQHGVQISP